MGGWFAENGLLLGLAALDGLSYAALVFMVAVGLNMVFGVLRIVNVAHGSLFAIGAYAAASIGIFFAARGLPPAPVVGFECRLAEDDQVDVRGARLPDAGQGAQHVDTLLLTVVGRDFLAVDV